MVSRVSAWALRALLALLALPALTGCGDDAAPELVRPPEDAGVDLGVLPPDATPSDAVATDGAGGRDGGDASPEGGAPRPALGLAPGPGSTTLPAQGHLDVLAVGSRAAVLPVRWAELVPDGVTPDAARWTELRALTRLHADAGARVVLALGVVEGGRDARPAALQQAWDSPTVVAAGEALVDGLLAEVGTAIDYLALGVGVDAALAASTGAERDALARLLEQLAARARTRPGILVAASVGAGAAAEAPQALTLLSPLVDAWLVEPRLLDAADGVRAPQDVVGELEAFAAATELPLALWGLGATAAPEVGGSPEGQRGHHAALLDWLLRRGDRVSLAVLDHHRNATEPHCSAWAAAQPAGDTTALALARCALGLRDSPAWPLVLAAMGTPE